MKKITNREYKEIILDIFKSIDKVCRDNDIKYTLTGGTLIGAIREKKMLDWDDDIDIVMSKSNFDKFCVAFEKKNHKDYLQMIKPLTEGYPLTFSKIVDTRTMIKESNSISIPNYGAFVDLFVNHNVPDNKVKKRLQYMKLFVYRKIIDGYLRDENTYKNEKGLRKLRTFFAKRIDNHKIIKKYLKTISQYDDKETQNVVKDFVGFGYKKDIQPASFFDNYIDVDFNGMKAMAIKEYDHYLSLLFGDYMTPPPKEKQICHNIEAYWKEKE